MKFQTTLVLILLLGVVGAYFYLVEAKTESGREIERRQQAQVHQAGSPLFSSDELSAESVTMVTIAYPGQPLVVMEKDGAKWWQVKPVRFAVKSWSIQEMIDQAASLRYTAGFNPQAATGSDDEVSLQDAELEQPLATVTLGSGKEGRESVVRLGRRAVGGQGFAMRGDRGDILAVNDALHKQILEEQPEDWRSRSLDVPAEGKADSLSVTSAGLTIAMGKGDNGWSFEAPIVGRVDGDVIKKLLADVGGIYVKDFVVDRPEDLAPYGLDRPVVALTVRYPSLAAPETQPASDDSEDVERSVPALRTMRFAVGAAADLSGESHFACWINEDDPQDVVVFVVSDADKQKLTLTVDGLRDRRVTPIASGDVRDLSIERQDHPGVYLDHGPDGWVFRDPGPGFAADSGVVSGMIDAMVTAKASAFVTDASIETAKPIATVRMNLIGGVEAETLRLFRQEDKGTLLIRRNQEHVGYVVGAGDFDRVLSSPAAMRDRTVLDLREDEVVGIEVENRYGAKYVFRQDSAQMGPFESQAQATGSPSTQPDTPGSSRWRLEGDDTFEDEAFDRLVSVLLPLRCDRWGVEADSTTGAGSDPALTTVQVESMDGTKHHIVVSGVDGHGWMDDSGDGFVLDLGLVRMLEEEFRDRTVLALDIDHVDRVVLTGSGATLTVVRTPSGRYEAQGGGLLDEGAVGSLVDSLAPLGVVRYTQPIEVLEPVTVIEVTQADGRGHVVKLFEDDLGQHLASVDGRWCVLDDQTFDRLTADVTKVQDPSE